MSPLMSGKFIKRGPMIPSAASNHVCATLTFRPHVHPHVEANAPLEHAFNEFDDELKEAIRRSLQDVAPKEEAVDADVKDADNAESVESNTTEEKKQPIHPPCRYLFPIDC